MESAGWIFVSLLLAAAVHAAQGCERLSDRECARPGLKTGCQTVASGRTAAGQLRLQPYLFETRSGEKVQAQMGRLTVPANRQRPSDKTMELVFVRFISTAERPGSPVLYLEGGPGNSGIDVARGPAFPLLMSLREVADVIVLDQRGTGLSTPIPIGDESWGFPLDRPADRAEMLRIASDRIRTCVAEMTRRGIDLTAYNTEEMADDVEALRVALHAEKISLWGVSFGTHLALDVIRRYPHHVDRAILAGVNGPDCAMIKQPRVTEQQLMKVDALLKADPVAVKAMPNLIGLVRNLLAQLERQPAMVEITDPRSGKKVAVTIGKWDAQFYLAARLRATWGISSAPGFFGALARGDLTPLAQAAFEFRTGKIGNLMPLMTITASGASAQRLRRARQEAAKTVFGDAENFLFPELVEALGSPDLGPAFRAPIRSDVPTLFISGTLDGRTPLSDAEAIRKGFANGQQLIVDGASHGFDLFYSFPGAQQVMLGFLEGHPLNCNADIHGSLRVRTSNRAESTLIGSLFIGTHRESQTVNSIRHPVRSRG